MKYKLTYFNGRGRAEISRLIFAAAGAEYEDHRIKGEDWGAFKASTPFGALPLLEVNGVTACQSMAIARYLAKTLKLAGQTPLEEMQADMISACVEDLFLIRIKFVMEKDEARKADEKKKMMEAFGSGCEHFEKILSKNNQGQDGYFVGTSLTWADLMFFNFFSNIKDLYPLDKYPKLAALLVRVEKLPRIAAWLAKRPQTEF